MQSDSARLTNGASAPWHPAAVPQLGRGENALLRITVPTAGIPAEAFAGHWHAGGGWAGHRARGMTRVSSSTHARFPFERPRCGWPTAGGRGRRTTGSRVITCPIAAI